MPAPSPLSETDAESSRPPAWLGPVGLIVLGLVLVVVMFTALRSPLKDDIAWLLYVARRWMAGRELYVDLVEVNPPLIVWISAIPMELSEWLEVPTKFVAMPGFVGIVLACAWWTAHLMRRHGGLFSDRLVTFSVIGIIMLILPAGEVGQREHLLVALTMPYMALFAGELAGMKPATRNAIIAGVLAAIGCAMKPRYVGVAIAFECVALMRGLRPWRALPLAGVLSVAAYAAAVAVLSPAYIKWAVPMAVALYGATDVSMWQLFVESSALLGGELVMAGLLVLRWNQLRDRWLILALMIFAGISSLICFLDGKDWYYHRIPATVATVLALLCWAGAALGHRHHVLPRARSMLAIACLVFLMLFFGSLRRFEPQVAQAVEPDVTTVSRLEAIVRKERARSYLAFSEWIALGFPVVNNTGVTWASRFDSMWALKGELWRARFDPHASRDWPVARWVVNDFVTGCPDIAVVDTREDTDYIGVLTKADPVFGKVWSRYRQIDAFDGLIVYKRSRGGCIDPWIAAESR